MRIESFSPVFVEFIPRELERGILYISERFSTAAHACACGCGEKVVTPLSPANWRLEKHSSKAVSLYPSIGNWNYECKSHYWIRQNRVVWAGKMSEKQIAQVQKKDISDQAKYVERVNNLKDKRQASPTQQSAPPSIGKSPENSLWHRFLQWLGFCE